MQTSEMVNQVIAFQKSAFDTAFGAVARFQDQAQQTTTAFLQETGFVPEEGIKAREAWIGVVRKSRDDYKKLCDQCFDTVNKVVAKPFDFAPKK
jgi:hypothetical protein